MVYDGSRGRTAITFNGEVYGYQSLRRRYNRFAYRTESDTELLLAAYDADGVDMLRNIPGMFAFAIWDDAHQRLFCARDRFGEKPLYYAIGRDGEFVFASEVPAILASGLVDVDIDSGSLASYLQHLYVPTDRSIYAQVRQVPPAHSLIVDTARVEIAPYWRFPVVDAGITLRDAVERLRFLLQSAVSRQLVADVPVGVFLSGGLDSTTIAMSASSLSPRIRSFSFEFPGTLSETRYARAASDRYQTLHTSIQSRGADLPDAFRTVIRTYGEPFADTSAIPTYFLCKEVSAHTKVALTGDGGDELLGGYRWYQALSWMERYPNAPWFQSLALRIASRTARVLRAPFARRMEERSLGVAWGRLGKSLLDVHKDQVKIFTDSDLRLLGLRPSHAAAESAGVSLDDAMRHDVLTYLPGDVLTKIDRASMAHGLELRAPFLDVELAEFALTLPTTLKLRNSVDKYILRQSFERDWPPAIRRRSKQGFGGPVNDWLALEPMVELLADHVWSRQATIRHYLDIGRFAKSPSSRHGLKRWALLCFGAWLDQRDASPS